MRKLFIGISILAMTACSKAPEREADRDTADPAPGINVTAAPGVAFDYRYTFRLPADRIGGVQEIHAQACERLGLSRCRITGMRYRLTGRDSIEGMLAFKLDPVLARAFGKQGIAAIQAAQGMLVDAEIAGTDAGAEIGRQADLRRHAEDERARLDRELAKPGLGANERAELQRQRSASATEAGAAQSAAADANATLASTPVTFDYESGRAISGFGNRSALAQSLDMASQSTEFTVGLLISALALLGPPALLLAALWFGWRWLRRRYFPSAPPVV